MSDSLVLTGVKDVKKHTGTEMLRLNPKGGGDVFKLKRWWVKGGSSTVYVDATVFSITTAAGTVKLALATTKSTHVRIGHDGSFNFTFGGVNNLSRAALYTDSLELIEHYEFPSISGGKVMTVTPPGSASRPVPSTSIGSVTVTGDQSVIDGDTEMYNVSISGGTAGSLSYAWTATGTLSITSGGTSTQVTCDVSGTGAGTITCEVDSADPNVTNSPQSDQLAVTASAS